MHTSDVEAKEYWASIFQAFLTLREEVVIRLRFGFDDAPWTLRQVSEELNVSVERVRQIERRAIRKLRVVMTGLKDHGLRQPSIRGFKL